MSKTHGIFTLACFVADSLLFPTCQNLSPPHVHIRNNHTSNPPICQPQNLPLCPTKIT